MGYSSYFCGMNLAYEHLLPQDFSGASRVWIYQCNRMFTLAEVLEAEHILNEFTAQWNAHGTPVKGFATVFFGQFVILVADETNTGVSGCSTDSSVRMVKEIEQAFKVSLFDRQLLAFVKNDKVQMLPLNQLNYAIENNFINADTFYFNNTVLTLDDLKKNWLIPVKNSWLSKKLNNQAPAL